MKRTTIISQGSLRSPPQTRRGSPVLNMDKIPSKVYFLQETKLCCMCLFTDVNILFYWKIIDLQRKQVNMIIIVQITASWKPLLKSSSNHYAEFSDIISVTFLTQTKFLLKSNCFPNACKWHWLSQLVRILALCKKNLKFLGSIWNMFKAPCDT